VRVITPYNETEYTEANLRLLSNQEPNVLVYLPADASFLEEMQGALQISKYITKNPEGFGTGYAAIKTAKQSELQEKLTRSRTLLSDAMAHAQIFANGEELSIGGKQPADRLHEALGKLVEAYYHKLKNIVFHPSLADIEQQFNHAGSIEGEDAEANPLALDELLQIINLNTQHHQKTTLKNLLDRFSKAPYGYIDLDVQWLVAALYRQGKVSLTMNSQILTSANTDAAEFVRYLTKKEYFDKIIIERREKATPNQIKYTKEIIKELFGLTSISDVDDALLASFRSRSQQKIKELTKLEAHYLQESRYPGQTTLLELKTALTKLSEQHNPAEFFQKIEKQHDQLLNLAEDIIPVEAFFNGEQHDIFIKALSLADIYALSKTYVVDHQVIDLAKALRNILEMPNPYGNIYKLPPLIEDFRNHYGALLDKEAAPVKDELANDKAQVLAELNGKEFAEELQSGFLQRFTELEDKLKSANKIPDVKNIRIESDALRIRCLDEIAAKEKQANPDPIGPDPIDPPPVIKTRYVSMKQLASGKTITIKEASDVDTFIAEIKQRLLAELASGEIIKLT